MRTVPGLSSAPPLCRVSTESQWTPSSGTWHPLVLPGLWFPRHPQWCVIQRAVTEKCLLLPCSRSRASSKHSSCSQVAPGSEMKFKSQKSPDSSRTLFSSFRRDPNSHNSDQMQPQSLSPMHRPGKSCHAGDLDQLARLAVQHPPSSLPAAACTSAPGPGTDQE